MEESKNTVEKATVKNERCEASYKEKFLDANYSNDVTKKCDQIVHADLKAAFQALVPFLVTITEQPEAKIFNAGNINADILPEDITKEIAKYTVTGYSHGGSDESAGVTLIGIKCLKSGQVLNLIAPFTKFDNGDADGYLFGAELDVAIQGCDWEVSEYLFNEKYGIKQETLDFDGDVPDEAVTDGVEKKPKGKKGKGKKAMAIEPAQVFDETA